jgi:hypothetical protein
MKNFFAELKRRNDHFDLTGLPSRSWPPSALSRSPLISIKRRVRALLLPRNTGFGVGISEARQTAEFHFPNFVTALLSAAPAMNPPNFFAELKRRNVIRVVGLSLAGAWLLVQVASTMRRIDCREIRASPDGPFHFLPR